MSLAGLDILVKDLMLCCFAALKIPSNVPLKLHKFHNVHVRLLLMQIDIAMRD